MKIYNLINLLSYAPRKYACRALSSIHMCIERPNTAEIRLFRLFKVLLLVAVLSIYPIISGAFAEDPSCMAPVVDIKTGAFHTIALAEDGTVWAWGSKNNGACGVEDKGLHFQLRPNKISGLHNITAIDTHDSVSVALDNDGSVWIWGSTALMSFNSTDNVYGSHIPVRVPGIDDAIGIACGDNYVMVLKKDGTVKAWGNNECGNLGDGLPVTQSSMFKSLPGQVSGLSDVKEIYCTGSNSLALKNDGTVWAWGRKSNLLGNWSSGETKYYVSSPVRVEGVDNVASLSAGEEHIVLIKNDGTVWALGDNEKGKLGIGPRSSYTLTPVCIMDLHNIVAVDAGQYHSIVLDKDGNVYTWGWNDLGQIGNGEKGEATIPYKVPGIIAKSIFAGGSQTFIIDAGGDIWAWGYDESGQLGDGHYGSKLTRRSPVKLSFDNPAIDVLPTPDSPATNTTDPGPSTGVESPGFTFGNIMTAMLTLVIVSCLYYFRKDRVK